MKNVCLILFLLISSGSYAQKQSKTSILKVLEDQRQAWNKGDLEGYMDGYMKSDSLVFIGKDGPEYGWKTIMENYRKAYPDKAAMGFLTFDIKDIRLISSTHAFVIGAWHLKRKKDEPKGSFTLLVKKIKGQWKVIADHSS